MKILVAVKRVIDYNVKVRVKPDNTGVDTAVKMSINPFDEIAVEEAVRWKEAGHASEITVVSIGDACQETLRHALALGADKAILVHTDDALEPLHIAKCLQRIATDEGTDCVILGKQSIDGDNNQTGQMLAALLDWPQGTFAYSCDVKDSKIVVTREIDGGLETVALTLPAVVTTDLRLNTPRYAALPNIMKAKQKPLTVLPLADLGVETQKKLEILEVTPPPIREGGVKVESVSELVDKLRTTAKVLP